MRAGFTIIFLGWWLSRKRWMTQGQYQLYPRPSISVSPSEEIYLRENITISCKSEHYSQMTFILARNEGTGIKEKGRKQAENGKVDFSIINAKKDNEGNYSCAYYYNTGDQQEFWSDYSIEVPIQVRDQVYPKPSISISPNKIVTLREDVTIHCQAQEKRPAHFHLKKKGGFIQQRIKTKNDGTIFSFEKLKYSDGGIYWCEYKSHQRNVFSYLTDPVQINITDPKLSRPSIKGRIKRRDGGINAELNCEGPEKGLTFSLFKANSWMGSQRSESDKNETKFSLKLMNLEDEENYTCRYQDRGNPFIWSEPSEPAQLSWEGATETIIWASIGVGLLFLVLLLVLLAFILCRKRKGGSSANEENQPGNVSLQPITSTEPDEVSYAALNHSVKIKQTFVPQEVPESCVYASVAKDRTIKEG